MKYLVAVFLALSVIQVTTLAAPEWTYKPLLIRIDRKIPRSWLRGAKPKALAVTARPHVPIQLYNGKAPIMVHAVNHKLKKIPRPWLRGGIKHKMIGMPAPKGTQNKPVKKLSIKVHIPKLVGLPAPEWTYKPLLIRIDRPIPRSWLRGGRKIKALAVTKQKRIPRSWLRGGIKHKIIGMPAPEWTYKKPIKNLSVKVEKIKGVPPPRSTWAKNVRYVKRCRMISIPIKAPIHHVQKTKPKVVTIVKWVTAYRNKKVCSIHKIPYKVKIMSRAAIHHSSVTHKSVSKSHKLHIKKSHSKTVKKTVTKSSKK